MPSMPLREVTGHALIWRPWHWVIWHLCSRFTMFEKVSETILQNVWYAAYVWFLDFTMVVTISSGGRQAIWPDQPEDEPSESKGFETVCRPPQCNHFLNGGTRFQMLCMPTNQICPGRLFPSLWPISGWKRMHSSTPRPLKVHAWLGLQSVTRSSRHNGVEHTKMYPGSIDTH